MIPRREQSMISMVKKGLKAKCHLLMQGDMVGPPSSKLGMAQQCSGSTPEMLMTFSLSFSAIQAHLEEWEAVAVARGVVQGLLVEYLGMIYLAHLERADQWVKVRVSLLPLRRHCRVPSRSYIRELPKRWGSQGKLWMRVGKYFLVNVFLSVELPHMFVVCVNCSFSDN